MPTPVKWKDSFQVNTGDAGLGIQSEARIIGLANGRILVAWTESASGIIGSGAGLNIIGQYLDVRGNPTGSPFQINTLSVADDEKDFDIAATSDGFVIVYVDGDIGTERTSIIWERRQFSGTVDTLRVADETSADYDFESPQVAVNQLTNNSMVTYSTYENGDADVLGVVVSAAGAAGAGFDVADNDEFPSTESDVAILANGNYIAVFRDFQNGEMEAGWRIMTSAGVPVATFTVATPVIEIKVATLTNGNWVMAFWHGSIISGEIRFQIWTPTGGTASNTVIVASGDDSYRDPDVVALPDGGFVVLWENTTTDTLLARRFTSTGASDGTIFTVATSVTGGADVAVTGDGRILFTWTDEASQEVFASIWDPRGATVNATDYQANDRNFLETLYVTGGVGATTINGNGVADAVLIGQEGSDVITGGANNQNLIGNGGDDILFGGGGDPNAGIGGDIMAGGLGNDIYYVDHVGAHVVELADQGRDVVYASVNWVMTGGSRLEVLSTISQAAGAALQLTGNEFFQEIYGNAGDNVIDGGGGADYLQGFAGNDIYFVGHGSDLVVETAGGGRDVIYTSVNFTLGASSEIEVLSTSASMATTLLDLTGNGLFNEIYGNAGANIIDGGGGGDYLQGYGGNDLYFVNHGSDLVIEGAGQGTRDVIYARTSYTLAAGVQVEVLSVFSQSGGTVIDLTGNERVNELYGNTEANYLDGGGGADFLQGFGGNDSYVVEIQGDVVIEGAGEGTRDVVFARASYALGAGQQIEVLSAISSGATTAIDLIGNALANELYGNAGANVLNGGLGADYLLGFAGADSFAFTTALGAGNVDQIGDFVSGTDKILLDDAVFTGLTAGALPAGAFVTGAAAADADDRIVYNSATGQIFFDADGSGAGVAVLFATLGGNPALGASDFMVI